MEVVSSGIEQLGFENELYPNNLRSLVSCGSCGYVLKDPVTTGCGASYCRSCIMPTGDDTTYCPIDKCRAYTSTTCHVDITMKNVLGELQDILEEYNISNDFVDSIISDNETGSSEESNIETPYIRSNLFSVVQKTLEKDRTTMQCAICLNRFLDPVTTKCGHTFCQNCLRRNVDQLPACPACRTAMEWPFEVGSSEHHDPLAKWNYNRHLASIISTCWKPWVIERQQLIEAEENTVPPDMDIALFVCTTAYPGCNTYLRVFEPRYRLMLRRIMNSPHRTFGMIDTSGDTSDGIAEYGTLIKILTLHHGRNQEIVIKSVGVSRFKVKEKQIWDGYYAASIDPIVDAPVNWDYSEKMPSGSEVTRLAHHGYRITPLTIQWVIKLFQDNPNLLKCLTNQELLQLIKDYIQLQSDDGHDLSHSLSNPAPGGPPVDDEHLVWLFAHVNEFPSECALPMLGSTTIRERLSMVLWWIVNNVPHQVWPLWFPQQPFPGGPLPR